VTEHASPTPRVPRISNMATRASAKGFARITAALRPSRHFER